MAIDFLCLVLFIKLMIVWFVCLNFDYCLIVYFFMVVGFDNYYYYFGLFMCDALMFGLFAKPDLGCLLCNYCYLVCYFVCFLTCGWFVLIV